MTISDLPAKYQAEAYRQLGQAPAKPLGVARATAVGRFPVEVVPTPSPRARGAAKPIRQRQGGDGMNKWEREFLAKLGADFPSASIHREVSLPLCNGARYKVDFLVGSAVAPDSPGPTRPQAYEVKGQKRSTGILKLKVAASLYPWIVFHIVTRPRKGGAWQIDQVYP